MGADFETDHVRVTGADALIARLTVIPGNAKEAALQGMLEMAEEQIIPDIKEKYVPFKYGILSSSCVAYREGDEVRIEAGGQGSGAELYAVEQHENLTYVHPLQGGPKYIERPLIAWAEKLIQKAGQAVSNILEVTNGFGTEYRTISKIDKPKLTEKQAWERIRSWKGYKKPPHTEPVHTPTHPKPAGKAPPRLVKKKK